MMIEILIQGGNPKPVARDMGTAFREIFGVEPLVSARGGGSLPGTRSLEPYILALAIPPAVVYTQNIARQLDLAARWHRLIDKAIAVGKDKPVAILIDTGNGKPVPLDHANRDHVVAAVRALEARLKA